MDIKEVLQITNKREVNNIIGKEIKNASFNDGDKNLVITFSDGSTYTIICNLFELQTLFLNKS